MRGKSRAMETHFYPIQICMFMKQAWRQCKNNALKQGLMVYMSGLFFSGSVKASWRPKLRVDRIFAKIKTLRHDIFAWPNLRVFFWTKSSRPSQNREVMSTRSLKSRIGGRREEIGVYSTNPKALTQEIPIHSVLIRTLLDTLVQKILPAPKTLRVEKKHQGWVQNVKLCQGKLWEV